MAVTIANREIIHRGAYTDLYVEITLDSSYLTGGEVVTAEDFGMKLIKAIWIADDPAGYTVECTRTSDSSWKFKVYSFSTTTNTLGAEMVSAKDLSAVTIRCRILGR